MTEWGGGSIPKMKCPQCDKRLRGSAGVRAHIIAKHGGKGKGAFGPDGDDDESFADRAVQAGIDRACGIPTDDDWLLP